MTHSVTIIIATLAILLSLHIFIIAYLLWSRRKNKQANLNDKFSCLVVYASQSGHAEAWAKHTAEHLRLVDDQTNVKNIQELTANDLIQYQRILWVVSTYGDGDAPDPAQSFVKNTISKSLDLSHLSFAILALGDRRYSNFCQFGKTLEQWLLLQSAQNLFATVLVDQMNSRDLEQWLLGLEQLTAKKLSSLALVQPKLKLQFAHRQYLNRGSIGAPIYKVDLLTEEDVYWSSGDILEIECENQLSTIHEFLAAQHQESVHFTAKLRNLNLRKLPIRKDLLFAEWIEHFETLPKREYSIASLPENGFIELVVRQQQTEEGLGLGSGWLTVGLEQNQIIHASIRQNPIFNLEKNERPIILIGNGTGIAGLVAHLRQREQWGHKRNWLVFGERQQQFDHLYRSEIQYWQQHGFLEHIDYAFSQDQFEKIYVQDRLKEQAVRLQDWIAQGAAIYVCGSLHGMANGVESALKEILGGEHLEQLRQEQRYQRDVY